MLIKELRMYVNEERRKNPCFLPAQVHMSCGSEFLTITVLAFHSNVVGNMSFVLGKFQVCYQSGSDSGGICSLMTLRKCAYVMLSETLVCSVI